MDQMKLLQECIQDQLSLSCAECDSDTSLPFWSHENNDAGLNQKTKLKKRRHQIYSVNICSFFQTLPRLSNTSVVSRPAASSSSPP